MTKFFLTGLDLGVDLPDLPLDGRITMKEVVDLLYFLENAPGLLR